MTHEGNPLSLEEQLKREQEEKRKKELAQSEAFESEGIYIMGPSYHPKTIVIINGQAHQLSEFLSQQAHYSEKFNRGNIDANYEHYESQTTYIIYTNEYGEVVGRTKHVAQTGSRSGIGETTMIPLDYLRSHPEVEIGQRIFKLGSRSVVKTKGIDGKGRFKITK